MKKQTQKKSKGSSLLKKGVVAGAIGALAYEFMGPEGKKNRAKVMKLGKELKDEAMDIVENVKKVVGPTYQKIKKEINDNDMKNAKKEVNKKIVKLEQKIAKVKKKIVIAKENKLKQINKDAKKIVKTVKQNAKKVLSNK